MYSILLIEDEVLELETLKNYVNWDKIGIDKVYTGLSGNRQPLGFCYKNRCLITQIIFVYISGSV